MFGTSTITRCNEPGKIKVKFRFVFNSSPQQIGGYPPKESKYFPSPPLADIMWLLNYAVQHQLIPFTVDIKNAYPNTPTDTLVVAFLPQQETGWPHDCVVRLTKNMYGHPEAANRWGHYFADDILSKRMHGERCPISPCIFRFVYPTGTVLAAVYADDLMGVPSTPDIESHFITTLRSHVPIGSYQPISRYVGMDIDIVRDSDGTFHFEVHHGTYRKDIPSKLGKHMPKDIYSGPAPQTPITIYDENLHVNDKPLSYTELPPDIMSITGVLNWILSTNPGLKYAMRRKPWNVHRVLAFFLRHPVLPLYLYKNNDGVPPYYFEGLCDSRGPPADCYGYFLRANRRSGALMHDCKRFTTPTLSSGDAESGGTCECGKSAIKYYSLNKWCYSFDGYAATIFNDNQVVLRQINHPIPTHGSRYYHVRLQAIRGWVQEGYFKIEYIPGELNAADIMTRAVPIRRFRTLQAILHGAPLPPPSPQMKLRSLKDSPLFPRRRQPL
jgi:hypothetical protein